MYRVVGDSGWYVKGLSVIDAFYFAQTALQNDKRVMISLNDHWRRWWYMRENGMWTMYEVEWCRSYGFLPGGIPVRDNSWEDGEVYWS